MLRAALFLYLPDKTACVNVKEAYNNIITFGEDDFCAEF